MSPKRPNGPAKAFISKHRRPLQPPTPVKQREITLRATRFMTADLSFRVMDVTSFAETLYEVEIDIDASNGDLDKAHGDCTLKYLVLNWLPSMTFYVRSSSQPDAQVVQFDVSAVSVSSYPDVDTTLFGDLSLIRVGVALGKICFQINVAGAKLGQYMVSAAPPQNGSIYPSPPLKDPSGNPISLNSVHGNLHPAAVAKLLELLQFSVGPCASSAKQRKKKVVAIGTYSIRPKLHCE
jgi:hypothetical protein